MRVKIFCHSLISDWNHGNAHFLRGVASDLIRRGHDVDIYEPENAWSVENLLNDQGPEALLDYRSAYPELTSTRYQPGQLDLSAVLSNADLVLVHEWNDPELVGRIGEDRRASGGYKLLFHDTHHRCVSDPKAIKVYDLSRYDGVLAFGEVVRNFYLEKGLAKRVWTWHEAADTTVFRPIENVKKEGDLVWIGNWGDEERTAELEEFLFEPVKELGLKAKIYGVRYPPSAIEKLRAAGIEYGGWLPNYQASEVYAKYRLTVHIPRRPYTEQLPGIPTIRPFEAMACGIPLISSPWADTEGLFTTGEDYLVATNGDEMRTHIEEVLNCGDLREKMTKHALHTIHRRHTCAHRVDQLLSIYAEMIDSGQSQTAIV